MTKMRIGYAKLGRSIQLDSEKWSVAGGDRDAPRLLYALASRFRDVEWVLVGRNSGGDLPLFPNVTNPWNKWKDDLRGGLLLEDLEGEAFLDEIDRVVHAQADLMWDTWHGLDGLVVWAGQHGTCHSAIPRIQNPPGRAKPYVMCVNYGGYLLELINRWRDKHHALREEVWLCPDPRNVLTCRDLKWPLSQPVLGQYDLDRWGKHERYGDARDPSDSEIQLAHFDAAWDVGDTGHRVWLASQSYRYAGLEWAALPPLGIVGPENEAPGPIEFGLIANENARQGPLARAKLVNEWLRPGDPVWGVWTAKGAQEIGRLPLELSDTQYWKTLRSLRATITFPASGSGWATAKPWECFAAGVVCFFHPKYDDQDHVISRLPPDVAAFLRVDSPSVLETRRVALESHAMWCHITTSCRVALEEFYREEQIVHAIRERLGC